MERCVKQILETQAVMMRTELNLLKTGCDGDEPAV
jgi:hypothetical protein